MSRGARKLSLPAVVLLLAALLLGGPAANIVLAQDAAPAQARNVILLIPDGMGETHVQATRYSYYGRDGAMNLDRFDAFNQVHTYSADSLVTDSAAASTAIGTGVSTNNGVIGQDVDGTPLDDRSLVVLAEGSGRSTGLVTEVTVGHATPAGFASSVADRNMIPEIVAQYLDNDVDVILGGGEGDYLPTGTAGAHCIGESSVREDGRNLIEESVAAGYTHVSDREALMGAQPENGKLLGLFACDDMNYETTRQADEPTTAEKTQKAIEVLNQNEDGFFLMVERGKIDWAAEANDGANVIGDTKAFDDAVGVALDFAEQDGETLVLSMADHEAGGMSLVGYEDSAHEIFETADGEPMYIAYSTQPGHTGVPIALRASGPGSDAVSEMDGNQHLIDVYALMVQSMGIEVSTNTGTPEATPAG